MDKAKLTREEIEALLGAGLSPENSTSSANRPRQGRADPMEALRTVHQRAAERLAADLSAMLQSPVAVRFAGLRQGTFGRVLTGRERTACRCTLRSASPEGEFVLEVAASILHPMIARLLGGDPRRCLPSRRPMTDVEQRLATRIMTLVADTLGSVWSELAGVPLAIARVESGDAAPPTVPGGEPALVARFDLSLGERRGPVALCIPAELAAQIAQQCSARQELPDGRSQVPVQDAAQIGRALENPLVELRVELARTRITAGELIDLAVGAVITTDQPADAPLVIDVDGHARFHARAGIYQGKKAIQIQERIEP